MNKQPYIDYNSGSDDSSVAILVTSETRNEVAIGPVTGRTLYSYRSGSHVLSIFLFALILLVRVRNGVWCSVRLVLGLGIGFGLALG